MFFNRFNLSQLITEITRSLILGGFALSISAVPCLGQTLDESIITQEASELGCVDSNASFSPFSPLSWEDINDAIPSTYLLDSGDEVQIDIFDTSLGYSYSSRHVLWLDGTVDLPFIGREQLRRCSTEQVRDKLLEAYRSVFSEIDFDVSVSLVYARPLQISVAGAVHRPGSYALPSRPQNINIISYRRSPNLETVFGQHPTLTQAIRVAGGITPQANLERIIVRRPDFFGRILEVEFDLWQMLIEGGSNADLYLQDGDTIVVPINSNNSEFYNSILSLTENEITPNYINVYLLGGANNSRVIESSQGTTLNQLLVLAGEGAAIHNESEIVLLRLNPDYTVGQQVIRLNPEAEPGDMQSNPFLFHNDSIILRIERKPDSRNLTNELGSLTEPLLSLPSAQRLGILNIFEPLN